MMIDDLPVNPFPLLSPPPSPTPNEQMQLDGWTAEASKLQLMIFIDVICYGQISAWEGFS